MLAVVDSEALEWNDLDDFEGPNVAIRSAVQESIERLWTCVKESEGRILARIDGYAKEVTDVRVAIGKIEQHVGEHDKNIEVLFEKTKSGNFAPNSELEEQGKRLRTLEEAEWKRSGISGLLGAGSGAVAAWIFDKLLK